MAERTDRARKLLNGFLTRGQRKTLQQFGYVDVKGSDSGHFYRVPLRGVVARLEGRKQCAYMHRYCIELPSRYPAADQMLARVLMIQTNEKLFLRTAHYEGRY